MEESSIANNSLFHGYGHHYTYSGDYMEDYQMGEHFWNSLTKVESKAIYNYEEVDVEAGIDVCLRNDFKNMIVHEKAEIEDCVIDNDSHRNDSGVLVAEATDDDEVESYVDTRFHIEEFEDMMGAAEEPDDCPEIHDGYETDFIKATRKGDWEVMKKIANARPDILNMTTSKFHAAGTALHHTLWYGRERKHIAECLLKLMTPEGLETLDKEGYTTLSHAVSLHHNNDLLADMVEKNEKLPNIGRSTKIPVVVASWKGFADTTEFLYPLTDKNILSPTYKNPSDPEPKETDDPKPDRPGRAGTSLLNQCIGLYLFDFAEDLLDQYPALLKLQDDDKIYPTHALAKAMAALQSWDIQHEKSREWKPWRAEKKSTGIRKANKLLQFITRVEDFEIDIENSDFIADAMMEAAKHGIVEFINEILEVDRELISVMKDRKNIFWHAIMNRQEKVFNLIYGCDQSKDQLLSFQLKGEEKETYNVLHFAAELPPSLELDRVSGPALHMQRELQWFKAVQDVAKPRYRGNVNKLNETPYALFMKTHKDLLEEGEKSMKKTAMAASTVGGLIVTTIFGAALSVIAAVYQTPTSGMYDVNVFFVVFLILATLSLCSCTVSIIIFLGILASRYSPEDFLYSLPRKFMIGFWALFAAISSMMFAFCCALYVMLKGRKVHFVIVPIFLFSLVPVAGFIIYLCPLLWKISRSTNKTIFDKSTRLPEDKKESTFECC